MTPHERYEADAFEGWDESLAAVERRWDDAGGYDVLWGHSQGIHATT